MLKRVFILLVSIFSVISCTRDDGKFEISVDKTVYAVGAGEASVSIAYTVPGTSSHPLASAEIEKDADWLKTAAITESTVQLLVQANATEADRTAAVTLSVKGGKAVVCRIIQQAGGEPVIKPETTLVYIDSEEGNYTLPYTVSGAKAGSKVDVQIDAESTWLKATEVTASEVKFHATANRGAERAASVKLSLDGSQVQVVFVQNTFKATSVIKLQSTSISEPCEAHQMQVPYKITGEMAGKIATVDMAESVDWLKIKTVTASAITFTIEANTQKTSRSADAILSCRGAREVRLTVVQNGDNPFRITVSDVSQIAAKASFEPRNPAMTYAYSIEKKSLFEKYGSAGYIARYIESLEEMAEESGVAFKDLLAQGKTDVSVDNLKDGTDYYALAFDLAADKSSSGEVTILEFKTPKAIPSDNQISFEVSANGVVKVKTTNNDPYIFDVWDYASWKEMPTPMDLAEKFVEYMKGYEGAIEMYSHRGEYVEDYAEWLTPGKNVAFAFGYKDGITTDVFFFIFDWKTE